MYIDVVTQTVNCTNKAIGKISGGRYLRNRRESKAWHSHIWMKHKRVIFARCIQINLRRDLGNSDRKLVIKDINLINKIEMKT